ncbi:hypothetical protein [Costertonia aggregata]|uniref:Uncharacterized protein n=1 Tax=Costertonia aggregata TaxID=343403 RepID=A0A7H9ARI2_9FLAO|nr:hypothetical protein [Costertonia aggregata]QLG46017.1 hypothetical protein HYG79_11900 [Costertonia aggregata]
MAKSAMYYVDNYKIEIVNTIFGKEKVLLNGIKVSEKPTRARYEHNFSVGKNQYQIVQNKAHGRKGNLFEIKRNNVPVSLVNLLPQTSTQLLFLLIIMGLGIGFLIGKVLFKIIWPTVSV